MHRYFMWVLFRLACSGWGFLGWGFLGWGGFWFWPSREGVWHFEPRKFAAFNVDVIKEARIERRFDCFLIHVGANEHQLLHHVAPFRVPIFFDLLGEFFVLGPVFTRYQHPPGTAWIDATTDPCLMKNSALAWPSGQEEEAFGSE